MSSQEYEAMMLAGARKFRDSLLFTIFWATALVSGILLTLDSLLRRHWLGTLWLPLGVGVALFCKRRSDRCEQQAGDFMAKAGEIATKDGE
jgi:hypothetical protein